LSRILNTRKHNVSETGSVSVYRWGGNRKRPKSQNILFIVNLYLEFQAMGKVQKPSDHQNSLKKELFYSLIFCLLVEHLEETTLSYVIYWKLLISAAIFPEQF
jgi:hypothetical protein